MSDSLQPHESQHTSTPCPSPTPGVRSNSSPFQVPTPMEGIGKNTSIYIFSDLLTLHVTKSTGGTKSRHYLQRPPVRQVNLLVYHSHYPLPMLCGKFLLNLLSLLSKQFSLAHAYTLLHSSLASHLSYYKIIIISWRTQGQGNQELL